MRACVYHKVHLLFYILSHDILSPYIRNYYILPAKMVESASDSITLAVSI